MTSRRRFLQASNAGLAMSASTLFGRLLSAQSPATEDQTTRIFMNSRRTIAPLERNLFGSSLEHPGRAIYEGGFDPIRTGTSFPPMTGSMASARSRTALASSTRHGVPSTRIHSARTNTWRGARRTGLCR